ncbi:TPA: hypothetical protein ACTYSP_004303 [Citrobacter freundii]
MLWSVEKSVRLNDRDRFALIVYSAPLKMIVEVSTTATILKNDLLYPIENALYIINKRKSDKLKVLYAIEYSHQKWNAMINITP